MYYLVGGGGGGGSRSFPRDFPNFVRSIFTKYENQVFFKRKIDKYHIYSSSMIYENAIVRSKHKHFSASFSQF